MPCRCFESITFEMGIGACDNFYYDMDSKMDQLWGKTRTSLNVWIQNIHFGFFVSYKKRQNEWILKVVNSSFCKMSVPARRKFALRHWRVGEHFYELTFTPQRCAWQKLLMARFKLESADVKSDCSANCATTTASLPTYLRTYLSMHVKRTFAKVVPDSLLH